jgi:hypothetical protein
MLVLLRLCCCLILVCVPHILAQLQAKHFQNNNGNKTAQLTTVAPNSKTAKINIIATAASATKTAATTITYSTKKANNILFSTVTPKTIPSNKTTSITATTTTTTSTTTIKTKKSAVKSPKASSNRNVKQKPQKNLMLVSDSSNHDQEKQMMMRDRIGKPLTKTDNFKTGKSRILVTAAVNEKLLYNPKRFEGDIVGAKLVPVKFDPITMRNAARNEFAKV